MPGVDPSRLRTLAAGNVPFAQLRISGRLSHIRKAELLMAIVQSKEELLATITLNSENPPLGGKTIFPE